MSGTGRLAPVLLALTLLGGGRSPGAVALEQGGAGQPARAEVRYERSIARYAVPDVVLVNQDNARVSLPSLLSPDVGVALTFLFTSCSTICPVLTATFSHMRQELGPDAKGLRLVSISIDPDHDTPSVLKSFAKRFDTGTDWQLLTGDPAQVLQVLKAFDAFTGAKTNHQALTFFRAPGHGEWVRIKGFASAAELAGEYRRLRAE